jgi:phosphosulfolactate synthase (CoM biosynthesis protein A)
MPEKKKQFVIDEELVKDISNTLQAFIDYIDEDCARSGCMCDLRGEVCSQHISDVLHNFDSSLCLIEFPQKEAPREQTRP